MEEDDELEYDQNESSYRYKGLEDDVIKYICEKIVAMREQPFIEAVNNLRKDQELKNLEMIMEIQKNKAKWNSNAGGEKAPQIPGAQLHKQLYQQAQDNFTITDDKEHAQGKVTFKTKGAPSTGAPDDESRQDTRGSKRAKKGKANEDEDPNQGSSRMLKTEEIREICDKH